jgi:hypothetical protein
MFESKLFRSIHSHLSHITWLQSHHVISQFCFCIAIFTYLSLYNSFTLSHIHSSLYLICRTLRAHNLIFIIFSQNREITLLVDRQISWIDRVDFNREKDRNIEFNWFDWFDFSQIHISFNIITFDHRFDYHDSFVSIVELLQNHVRFLRRSWIDDKKHLRYRIDSKIDETTKK